jgi:hypothetical protein
LKTGSAAPTALDGSDQNQTLFVVKNRLRRRKAAGLRHRVGEQPIRKLGLSVPVEEKFYLAFP